MGRRGLARKMFLNEAALCAAFSAHARGLGFKVYAETGGFDLLLVAGGKIGGFVAGDQIGVEAKMTENVAVLAQALPRHWDVKVPHYYAVLVPFVSADLRQVAGRLKITPLSGEAIAHEYGDYMARRLQRDTLLHAPFHRHEVKEPCWLPACEVEALPGGSSGPRLLTSWKQNAIKVLMLGVTRGYLLRQDFIDAKVSMLRFVQEKWIAPFDYVKIGKKRVRRYVVLDNPRAPHLWYAEVTDALGRAGVFEET